MIDGFNFYLPAFVYNLGIYLQLSLFQKKVVPLDLSLRIKEKRLIGDSRGFVSFPFAILIGFLIGSIQGRIIESLYLSVGAQFGTVINSSIKRRFNLNKKEFMPLDHVDFILGASLMYISNFILPFEIFIGGILVGFVIHLGINKIVRTIWEGFIYKRFS